MSRITRLAAIAAVASLGTAGVALAQTKRAEDADIGFAFTAGTTTLPAGQYRVSVDMADPTMLLIQSRDHRVTTWLDTTMAPTSPSDAGPRASALVFDKYGDQYFLHEIWIGGEAHETQPTFLEARAEKRALAEHHTRQEQRVVTQNRG